MTTTCWNDAENAALLHVPLRARVVYLQGLRRFMDYGTGRVGESRRVSYQGLAEVCESLAADRGSCGNQHEGDEVFTRRQMRTSVDHLVAAGLLEVIPQPKGARRLVFFLPLADADDSVSVRHVTSNVTERVTAKGSRHVTADDAENSSDGAGFRVVDGGRHVTVNQGGHVIKNQGGHVIHPVKPKNTLSTRDAAFGVGSFSVTDEHRDYCRAHRLPDPDEFVVLFREVYADRVVHNPDRIFRTFMARQRAFIQQQQRGGNYERGKTGGRGRQSGMQILTGECKGAFETDD